MISLSNEVLNRVIKNNEKIVIKPVIVSCGWSGGMLKNLWIEIYNTFDDTTKYTKFKYNGISIFVHNELTVDDNVFIGYTSNSPYHSNGLYAKGISITK